MRIGSVPYLNARPLVHGLESEPDVELIYAVPSHLASMLEEGEVAAGIVSSVACFLNPKLQIMPGISISSIGPAESVRLFHKGEIESIHRVALDTSSLSSVTLARVILQERYNLQPEFVCMGPDLESMLRTCDAAVLIGDPAMRYYALSDWPSLDLGEEWHKHTGLPFVFAAWAVNPELAEPWLPRVLLAAKSRGLAALDEISEKESQKLGLDAEMCHRYLSEALNYELTPQHPEGLMLFRKKAQDLGLVPDGPPLMLFQQGQVVS